MIGAETNDCARVERWRPVRFDESGNSAISDTRAYDLRGCTRLARVVRTRDAAAEAGNTVHELATDRNANQWRERPLDEHTQLPQLIADRDVEVAERHVVRCTGVPRDHRAFRET